MVGAARPDPGTTTDYPVAIEGYRRLSGPVKRFTEACFEHELLVEPEGTVPVAIVNRGLGLGVYQVFRPSTSCPTTRCGG